MPTYSDYADIDALRIEHYPPSYIKHRGALVAAAVALAVIVTIACLALRMWRAHLRSRVLFVQLKAKKSGGLMGMQRAQFMATPGETSMEAPLLPPV